MLSVALVVAVLATIAADQARGCGMVTHNLIGKKALRFWEENYPGIEAMIARHQDAFQPGTPAPDWGYSVPSDQCDWCAEASEDFHWPPFYRIAAQYIRTNYPNQTLWDDETQKFITFLYGGWAHSTGDLMWHSLNGWQEGLINAMAEMEEVSWQDAHTNADVGGEFLVSNELNVSFILNEWYIPTDDMIALYAQAGYPLLTAELYEQWNRLLFVGAQAVKLGGWVLYPWILQHSHFMPEHYLDYFAGGVDDLGIWTSWCYDDLTTWFITGNTSSLCLVQASNFAQQLSRGQVGPSDRRIAESTALIAMAQLVDEAGLLQVETIRTARGTIFRLVNPPEDFTAENFKLPLEVFRNTFSAKQLEEIRFAQQAHQESKLKLKQQQHEQQQHVLANNGAEQAEMADCVFLNQTEFSASYGVPVEEGYLGTAVAVADLNNDGVDDLVMGMPGFGEKGSPQVGAVFIVYGAAGLDLSGHNKFDLSTAADLMLVGTDLYSRFGTAIAACDLNRDGLIDLAVSAPTTGSEDMLYFGAVYLFFGTPTGLPTSPSAVIPGPDRSANHGTFLLGADVDNDGFGDLVIGSRHASRDWDVAVDQVGMISLHLSSSATPLVPRWTYFGESRYAWFGFTAAFAFPYLFVGAPQHNPTGTAATLSYGKVYAFDMTDVRNSSVVIEPLFTALGDQELEQFGFSLAVGRPYSDENLVLTIGSAGDDEEAISPSNSLGVGIVRFLPIADILASESFPTFTQTEQLPSRTVFFGDIVFQRLGSRMMLTNIGNGGSGFDDLVAAEFGAYRNRGLIFVVAGGSGFPNGEQRGTVRYFSRACVEGLSDFGRFGSAFAHGDFNADGTEELVVASYRSYDRATAAGEVFIVPFY